MLDSLVRVSRRVGGGWVKRLVFVGWVRTLFRDPRLWVGRDHQLAGCYTAPTFHPHPTHTPTHAASARRTAQLSPGKHGLRSSHPKTTPRHAPSPPHNPHPPPAYKSTVSRPPLTLLPECFSSFPHGTCSLSVSCPYSALDDAYHPFWAAFPNNPTPQRQATPGL